MRVQEKPTEVDRLRAKLERAVDKLIAALDALDDDADLEPLLGAPESPPLLFRPRGRPRAGDQRVWADGGDGDEREQDDDLEPSLATPVQGAHTDQRYQQKCMGSDLELDPSESEYTLGWAESGSLTGKLGCYGPGDDREEDCEDEGAQCDDEGVDTDSEPEQGI
jgi:hypothetical protein